MIGLLAAVPAIPAQAGESHRRPHSSSANAAWIPAFAGVTEENVPVCAVRTIIPTFAGLTGKRYCRHSRAGGNPSMFAVPVCRSTGHVNRQSTPRHSREACPREGGVRNPLNRRRYRRLSSLTDH